jgi:hypothetical protein
MARPEILAGREHTGGESVTNRDEARLARIECALARIELGNERLEALLLQRCAGDLATSDDGAAFLRATWAGWGGAAFTCAALLEWCQAHAYPTRADIAKAVRALVGGERTAQKLGHALDRLTSRGSVDGLSIRRRGKRDGVWLWEVFRAADGD